MGQARLNHPGNFLMKLLQFIAAGFFMAGALLPGAAHPADLGKPAGEVILTIDGMIGNANAGSVAEFDLQMLEAMPRVTIVTSTPWTEGAATFEGVPLKDLLASVAASGANLSAVALNDYAAPLPVSDADSGAIVAYKIDGRYMPVRGKGPLWIMYPFDERPQLKTEAVYSRCAWQLRRLTVSK
jgi:hypothetical protein